MRQEEAGHVAEFMRNSDAFTWAMEHDRGVVETVRDESAVTVFLRSGVTDAGLNGV